MTGEMIERVAKAICRQAHLSQYPNGRWRKGELDAKIDAYWPKWEPAARAAIEAMREPTEAMLRVGFYCTPEGFSMNDVQEMWRAMIDTFVNPEAKPGDFERIKNNSARPAGPTGATEAGGKQA